MSCVIINGSALQELKKLESGSLHACVTSPPYWKQRDFKLPGELGNEDTPELYIESLVNIFGEVFRVLKDSGTLWVNIGDSYTTQEHPKVRYKKKPRTIGEKDHVTGVHPRVFTGVWPKSGSIKKTVEGLPRKSLIGIPWKLAFGLQAAGWVLRQDLIWFKSNARFSVFTDRFSSTHEYVFMLTKTPTYYFKKQTQFKKVRSVWRIPTGRKGSKHTAAFPEGLARICVLSGCPIGGTVLDPFGGSGTTGIACENSGMNSVLIELNKEHAQSSRVRLDSLG